MISGPDLVNGLFEAAGGAMTWLNVAAIRRDRAVRGVNVWATVLFNAWGLWNLWYYPHLGQWASAVGGLVIVGGNSAWLFYAWKYRPGAPCWACKGKRGAKFPMWSGPDNHLWIDCPACGATGRNQDAIARLEANRRFHG